MQDEDVQDETAKLATAEGGVVSGEATEKLIEKLSSAFTAEEALSEHLT